VIVFTLPFALESLNVRDRKHWAKRSKDKAAIAMEIIVAIGGTRYLPRPPYPRARITINRCSAGLLDPDGLGATAKNLLDAMCVRSSTHPSGIGIIEDDSARHIELIVTQSPAPRGKGATVVKVEPLPISVPPA